MRPSRDRLIERYGDGAKRRESQPFVAVLGTETAGQWDCTVNGREFPRPAVTSNEFAFTAQGPTEGDEVIMITSDANDMPTAVGVSPWIING